MSGHLQRLGQRLLDSGHRIRPRLPARFETENREAGAGFEQIPGPAPDESGFRDPGHSESRRVAGERPLHRVKPEPDTLKEAVPSPGKVPGKQPLQRPDPSGSPVSTTEQPAPPPSPSGKEMELPGQHPPEPIKPLANRDAPGLAEASGPASNANSSPGETESPAETGGQFLEALMDQLGERLAAMESHAVTDDAGSEDGASPAGQPGSGNHVADYPIQKDPDPAVSPVPARPLSVHIGTIIVRAQSPQSRQSAPRKPASGGQSLQDYLARRSSGGF